MTKYPKYNFPKRLLAFKVSGFPLSPYLTVCVNKIVPKTKEISTNLIVDTVSNALNKRFGVCYFFLGVFIICSFLSVIEILKKK